VADLAERIDAGLATSAAEGPPGAGVPAAPDSTTPAVLEVPFVQRTRLEGMLTELYSHLGPASFTAQWQFDQAGLLDAAARLLDDLRLIRLMPGGALVLPAAARYRNIVAALPDGTRHDGQAAFNFDAAAGSP
jgi:hypothetical protein